MENNVEELIVLGNGFDLQCGLKTTYENFFETTLKCLVSYTSVENHIEYFQRNIEECLEFKRYHNQKGAIPQNDLKKIPKNSWYQIFLFEKNNKNVQWNQIENVILEYLDNKNIINKLVEILKKINEKYEENSIDQFKEYIKGGVPLEEKIYLLVLYSLIDKNKLNYNNIVEDSELQRTLSNILLVELQDVEKDFIKFIKNEMKNSKSYINNVSDLLSKILHEDKLYNLLTFNYTFPFHEILRKPEKYLSVHGRVEVIRRKNNEIIFGIDHKDIEPTSLTYRFTKNYRTLQLYSTNPYYKDYQNVYSDTIKKIKFYGHSLAEADYSYFQQMFDYYDLYSNNDLQLIFYYSVYDEKKEEEIRQSQFNAISKLISTYGATLDNKDKGNNLLTRLMQTGRLRLIEI